MVHHIFSVFRFAAPLIVYFGIIIFFTLLVTHQLGCGYKLSSTQGFAAASNKFELECLVPLLHFAHTVTRILSTAVPLIEVSALSGLVNVVKAIEEKTLERLDGAMRVVLPIRKSDSSTYFSLIST